MHLNDNPTSMSRTDISAFLDYSPPIVSTQCGEIYCSQDLDYFLINCSTCTQEFNLLSISLFIKHIKECIPTNLKKRCEVEEEIINLSSDEDEEEHIVQNFIEDDPEDEEIATLPSEGIITQCETQSLSSVDDYKLTVEEEQIVQQSCDYNIQHEAQSLTNSGENLLALKQEFMNKSNGTTIDLANETIDISDYQDEDDLALHKLPRRTLLEMIIDEYRKHPVLWDITLKKKTSRRVRNHHLKQIWKAINSNFNANLTILDLQKHISRLRYGFERVLKKKEKFEKRHPDGSVKFYPQLWYFEKISFIKGTSKDCGMEQVSTNMSYASELSDEELLDEDEYSGSSKKENSKTLQRQEMLDMIREYKKYQVLWNKVEPLHYDRDSRNYAFGQITNFINSKYNKNLTIDKMRVRIANIRNKYSRVKKNKQMKNVPINLWYYNELSFIDRQYDNLDETNQNTSDLVGDYINLDNDDSVDDKTTVGDMLVKRQLGARTKDKNVLLAMIEEYRKQPRLWNSKIYSTSNTIRRAIYEEMAETINAKFNTNLTHSDFSREIHQMRYVYKRMLRRKQSTHRRFESSLWYADAISFINEGIKYPKKESHNLTIDGDSSCDVVVSKPQKERIYLRNKRPLRRAIRNKNDILNIIELYKSAPILWNTYHPEYHTWAERRKVAEKIIATLGEKYECFMTVDQFYNEIKLLRHRYVSALRRIINAKQQNRNTKILPRPFYFNQMSFLEPFVVSAGAPAPDLNLSAKIYQSEDFIFLTENKPLLKAFIELYETQRCLWDPMDKNKNNPFVQSASYERLIEFFSENNIKQTKEQVSSAIAFLHATVVDTQKTFEFGDPNTTNKPVWFYEHLRFLGNISGVKNKYCNHCGKYFRSITAYEKHRIEIAADSPYKCTLCNEGFKSLDLYTCHKRTHNELKKCDQCDFRSYNKHNLSVHMRSHIRSSQFPCEQCENGFFTSTELIRHIHKHTGKKIGAKDLYSSERKQICNICGESITRKETLVQHRLKHKCKSCGKLFPPKSGPCLNSNNLIPRHQCDDADLALE